MAASLDQLIADQQELLQFIKDRCAGFNQGLSILTPVDKLIADIESSLVKCTDKHSVLRSYADHEKVKPYLKSNPLQEIEEEVRKVREKLLEIQAKNMEEFTRVKNNYKKDSISRKNLNYLDNRLTNLEQAFNQVVDFNDAIKLIPVTDDLYFKNQMFTKTKQVYIETRDDIKRLIEAQQGEQEPEQINPNTSQVLVKSLQGPKLRAQRIKMEKIANLLRKVDTILSENSRNLTKKFQADATQKWMEIENLDEEIKMDDTELGDIDQYERKYTSLQQLYEEASRKLQRKLDYLDNSGDNRTPTQNKIHLKPIEMLKFDGNYIRWTTFIETFTNAVDRANLSDVEKFHYLLSNLESDAKSTINHLQITDANYQQAVELLRDRFENKRKTATAYIDIMLDLPQLQGRSADSVIKMHDSIKECTVNLTNMGFNITNWSPILTTIILKKFDYETSRVFEEKLQNPREIPTLENVMEFLSRRHKTLEAIKANKRTFQFPSENKKERRVVNLATNKSCSYCQESHEITKCKTFRDLSTAEKSKFVKSKRLCRMCLDHEFIRTCAKGLKCTKCEGKHNTLLHNPDLAKKDKEKPSGFGPPKVKKTEAETKTTTLYAKDTTSIEHENKRTCLPTAQVRVRTLFGDFKNLRALIDQGSQTTFITERAAQMLQLPKQKANIEIYGMGNTPAGTSKYAVTLQVYPNFTSSWTTSMEAKVMKKLTINHPEVEVIKPQELLDSITLADTDYNKPGRIDMIIGADYYHQIILPKQKKSGTVVAQKTTLGWILSGPMQPKGDSFKIKIHTLISHSEIKDLNDQLKKFWEVESMEGDGETTEGNAEQQYAQDVKRDEHTGRYTVKLPLRANTDLGSSREQALARLYQMEAKLKSKPQLKAEYNRFLTEYLNLGHMWEAPPKPDAYFLPHHAVIKPESQTTKVRVVFDASAKTTNGKSLNDIMNTGPNLLQDLMELLLRWRQHKVVFTADIEKMFRQIDLDKSQRDLQRILWRPTPNERIKEFQLNTVTYGTAAASFLAIRTLQQLANDEMDRHPRAAQILEKDFYMDDCLSGCQSKEEAVLLVNDLNNLLQRGGMHLRKWASNYDEILKNVPKPDQRKSSMELQKEDIATKTLGIFWSAEKDMFSFKVNYEESKITKRHILSTIARIYDPIGWLQPVVMIGKQFMKRVAAKELDWDAEVTEDIQKDWLNYANNLSALSEIQIPRWTKYTSGELELLGFCDASETAYAAAIYAKISKEDGNAHITLIAAKGKVAPSREPLTIPKLELKGALLLSELVGKCSKALQTESTVKLFCDSKIVLAWITGTKQRSDIFVNNRVKKINELTTKCQWYYVKSGDNPADCASRGLPPSKLKGFHLWWNGPSWIKEPSNTWINYGIQQETEIETTQSLTTANQESKQPIETGMWYSILRKFSSFNKTVRMVAWILRFKENCQSEPRKRRPAILTADDWDKAHTLVIQALQSEEYEEEVKALKAGKVISTKSHILKLTPFLDSKGLLRVGGRIQASDTPKEFKHPIILPKHSLTRVLARETHLKTLHGGTRLVLNTLREKYWIINGQAVVGSAIKACQRCHRFKATQQSQLMGNLPQVRVLPAPPFASTGIDYAGPFLTKLSTARTTKTIKTYIAVFVCMVTKAIHLELVTGLTSEAFLAALRRFMARRGNSKNIYTDNGTNFVGAQRALAQEYQLAIKEAEKHAASVLADEGVNWHFIPPRTPHFGGLWEAAIKSIKKHLRLELANKLLSFEEFTTILCRAEACVNSRPLTQLTSEPDDFEALTPGHFLIGRAITAPPESPTELSLHRRWDLLKQIQDNFWNQWKNDYMGKLLIRGKWNVKQPNLKIGELVLAKDKTVGPLKWPLARVVKLNEGPDGLVRKVDVNIGGTIKPLSLENIAKLPVDNAPEPEPPKTPKTQVNLTIKRSLAEDNQPQQQKKCKPTPRDWMRKPATDQIKAVAASLKSKRETHAKRARMSPWKKLGILSTTILALSMFRPTQAEKSMSIVYTEPGLYLEELGEIALSRGQVRLDINIKLADMRRDKEIYQKLVESHKRICEETKKASGDHHCDKWQENLQSTYDHIHNNVNVIIDQAKTRQKRGWLGQILTAVFGVNDEVYRSIDDLEDGQDKIVEKTTQQASLWLSTAQKLKTTTESQISTLNEKVNQGIALINSMQQWYSLIDKQKINYHMIAVSYDAENMLQELNKKYENIVRAFIDQGSIFDFITLYELKETIQKISAKLPSDIVVERQPNKKLRISSTPEEITIQGFLNLRDTSKFKLLAATAIPKEVTKGVLATTTTSTRLIAIDYNKQRYFNTTINEIEKCSPRPGNTHLCTVSSVHNLENNDNCMIDQILNRSNKWTCEVKQFTTTHPLWVQLLMENTWLMITTEATRIAVVCNGIREEQMITKTALIKIQNECTIKTRDINILSNQKTVLTVKGTYHKSVNVTIDKYDIGQSLHNRTQTINPIVKLEQPILPELPGVETYSVKHHRIEHHTFPIVSCLVLVILAMGTWTLRKRIFSCCTARGRKLEASRGQHVETST